MDDVVLGTRVGANKSPPNLVEMNWDPITRIVGSLGIFTKIDFDEPRGRGMSQHLIDISRI